MYQFLNSIAFVDSSPLFATFLIAQLCVGILPLAGKLSFFDLRRPPKRSHEYNYALDEWLSFPYWVASSPAHTIIKVFVSTPPAFFAECEVAVPAGFREGVASTYIAGSELCLVPVACLLHCCEWAALLLGYVGAPLKPKCLRQALIIRCSPQLCAF